jgi:alkylation response protein AidB-like acyl-CoA dehydrogenase
VVLAVTDKNDQKHGITAFAIEMDRKGIHPGKKENKLGMRVSDTAELVMEDCRVTSDNVLGTVGDGFVDSLRVLDGGRISIGALAVGIARGAYESARDYAKQRTAFGHPIADFQAIQFMLVDMATEIDAARMLCYRAATMKDGGERVTAFSAMAKLYASEVAVRCTEKGVQIFGGYGFIKDFPAEKYYRDVKLCTIGEGTSEIQRMVIARHILSEG